MQHSVYRGELKYVCLCNVADAASFLINMCQVWPKSSQWSINLAIRETAKWCWPVRDHITELSSSQFSLFNISTHDYGKFHLSNEEMQVCLVLESNFRLILINFERKKCYVTHYAINASKFDLKKIYRCVLFVQAYSHLFVKLFN